MAIRRMPAIVLAAYLLAALAGCSKEEKPFEKPPVPIETALVLKAAGSETLTYSASLVPLERVELAFKVGGYVRDIVSLPGPDGRSRVVQKGDPVKKGMVMAALREDDYVAALNKAKAARDEELASLREAQANFARYDRLFKEQVVARSELDKAREKLDSYTAASKRASHAIEEATLQLQDATLRSPLDGVVVSRSIEKGSFATPGTLAFVLADDSAVKAVFGVPDHALSLVKPGDALSVGVEAMGGQTFSGVVTSVAPSADPKSRVFDVEITIQNPLRRLKDGMIASVVLAGSGAAQAQPRLSVPLHAVVRDPADPAGFLVFVLDETQGKPKAKARKVTVGDVFGNQVVLLDGPAPGERVITLGATQVFDGAVVTVIK